MARGTVKSFDGDRGYGFITCENGDEVFVHFSTIAGSGSRSLNVGQEVEFRIGPGDPEALNVTSSDSSNHSNS